MMSLLNPIHSHHNYPSPVHGTFFTSWNPSTPPRHASNPDNSFENWDPDKYFINPTANFCVKKAILTSSLLNPNCFVFVLMTGLWCLAFCKIGDNRWAVIEFHYDLRWGYSDILDFTYSNGFLYTINHFAHVTIYYLNSRSRRVMSGPSIGLGSYRSAYLVEGVSGDILLIEHSGQKYEVLVKEIKHTVYILGNNVKPEWIELTDLGQDIVIMGGYNHAISFSSADLELPKWGAKCLFYDSIWNVDGHPIRCWESSYDHNIKLDRPAVGTVTDITGDFGLIQINGLWKNSRSG